jgi:hypothetical protein
MEDNNPSPDDPSGIGDRPQDAFVSERLTGPSERPAKTLELSGLLGDSDRPGYRRLYFTTQLDYYAEFASADVVAVETVPKDQAPFTGLEATRLTLRRDATVNFTQVRSAAPVDEFDLDVKLGREYGATPTPRLREQTVLGERCPGGTDTTIVWNVETNIFALCTLEDARKFKTQQTICGHAACLVTDNTCRTVCAGATCADQATCRTCAGQATCRTCAGLATCGTCDTCQTCGICDTWVRTCAPCQ